VFLAASDGILAERAEHAILRAGVARLAKANVAELHGSDQIKLRYQFEALGLIRAIAKIDPTDNEEYIAWSITDKGRRYLVQEKAVKRERES
jgi:hypothetical protein